MERKTKSIKVDPILWKKAKLNCVNKDIDISDYIEDLIKKDLKC